MSGGSGGGGNGGRTSGGGGGEPTLTISKKVDTAVVGSEFVKMNTKTSNGFELIQVKSGEWTYADGRQLSAGMGKKLVSQGKVDLSASQWGKMTYFKTKAEARSTAERELKRTGSKFG